MRPATRRIPRRIDKDDELSSHVDAPDESGPVVKRPAIASRTSAKQKKASTLRTSFASLQLPEEDVDDATTALKFHTSRQSDQGPSYLRVSPSDRLPLGARLTEERPTYDSNHLSELKSTTVSADTAKNDKSTSNSVVASDLDISSKFGDSALELAITSEDPLVSHIPSAAEIREKKERRKRLAKEQNYISLNDMGSDDHANSFEEDSGNEHSGSHSLITPAEELSVPSKYGETRLVHEDEDMAEGFDEFIEDAGKVALGRKAIKEQERQRRKDMEDQIRSAQHGYGYAAGRESSDDADADNDDEAIRNAAYDAVQTRAGTYGIGNGRKRDIGKEERLKKRIEIPQVKAVPEYKAVMLRLANMINAKEHEIEVNQKKLARLQLEQEEAAKDATRVQRLLGEAGERYETLKAEAVEDSVEALYTSRGRGTEIFATGRPLAGPELREAGDEQLEFHNTSLSTPSMIHNEQIGSRSFGGMGQIPTEEDEYSS